MHENLLWHKTLALSLLSAVSLTTLVACGPTEAEAPQPVITPVTEAPPEPAPASPEATAPSGEATPEAAGDETSQTDDLITANIIEALARDPYTERLEIFVETNNRRVELGGLVEFSEERQRAEEIASRVEGVQAVENNIVVSSEPQSPNDEDEGS